jgi:hypothetical protein
VARRERRRDPFVDGQKNPVTLVEQAAVDLYYDYSQLSESVREAVRRSAITIKPRLKRAAEDIFVIGQELQSVKERLPHGSYTDWLDVEFGLSERSAQRFVSVSERLGVKSNKLSVLPPSTLYLLAAPSTPDEAIQAVEKRIEAGERIRVATVKEVIIEARTKAQELPASERVLEGEVVGRAVDKDDRQKQVDRLDVALSQVIERLAGTPSKDWIELFHNDELQKVQQRLIELRDEVRRQC